MKKLVCSILLLVSCFVVKGGDSGVAESDKQLKEIVRSNPQVKSLTIYGKKITEQAIVNIEDLKELKSLSFNSVSCVTDKTLLHLKNMKNLESLTLVGVKITNEGLLHLTHLEKLKTLYLSGIQITDDGLKYLGHLESLDNLTLEYTKVKGSGVYYLKHLKRLRFVEPQLIGNVKLQIKSDTLKYLQIGGRNITGKGLACLKNLKSLEELALSGGKLKSSDLVYLKSLTQLKDLSFHRINIKDVDLIKYLKNLKNLKSIDFRNASVTDSAIAILKSENPKLFVCNIFPRIVDAYTKDGKIADLNSSFYLKMETKGKGNVDLKKKVLFYIGNNKRERSFSGGGCVAIPLNELLQDKELLVGENKIVMRNIPNTPIEIKISRKDAERELIKPYLLNIVISSKNGKTKQEIKFFIPSK